MAKPLVPPTPRSLVIGYVGGPGGVPVIADRVWADYWVRQIVERLGGTNGPDIAELQASIDEVQADADGAASIAASSISALMSDRAKAREEMLDHYLQLALAKISRLERRLKDIEDRTL